MRLAILSIKYYYYYYYYLGNYGRGEKKSSHVARSAEMVELTH